MSLPKFQMLPINKGLFDLKEILKESENNCGPEKLC
jgi:hypothetical protein